MAISKIYFMEFFETKSSFKDFTAFGEIYLIKHYMEMQKKVAH